MPSSGSSKSARPLPPASSGARVAIRKRSPRTSRKLSSRRWRVDPRIRPDPKPRTRPPARSETLHGKCPAEGVPRLARERALADQPVVVDANEFVALTGGSLEPPAIEDPNLASMVIDELSAL